MWKACIFDLDGTLADTLESIAGIANRVLACYGLDPQLVEAFKRFAGDGGRKLMERCLRASGGSLDCLDEAEQLYRDFFAENPLDQVKPYSGIPETLRTLKRRGLRLAVCSNKPHEAAVQVVEGLFGPDLFDFVQGQMPELPRKPAPDGPLLLARRMGAKPAECLYVGDTNTDMDTGRAAGMYTVGVLWGFRNRAELEAHEARRVICRPEELLALLEEPEEGPVRR